MAAADNIKVKIEVNASDLVEACIKALTEDGTLTEVVRCKDCKHKPTDPEGHGYGQDLEFPDEICPCYVGDNWYSWMPEDDFFCKHGERREDDD